MENTSLKMFIIAMVVFGEIGAPAEWEISGLYNEGFKPLVVKKCLENS